LLGGAELPALWAAVFVAALSESALHFASWAKLEGELETRSAKELYLGYLEEVRSVSSFCMMVRIGCSVLFTSLVVIRAVRASGHVPATVAAALAMLALAELPARWMGRRWSSGILRLLLRPLYWLSMFMRPHQLFGRNHEPPQGEEPEPEVVEAAKEEIRVAIEDGAVEGALEAEEKQMIEGILGFRDADVAEIMTPRTEIECLEADMPLPEALEILKKFRHSRIPVYDDTLDNVVGIVYVRDLIGAGEEPEGTTLRDVMKEPLFVPETKTIGPLLQDFQQQHVQIGVVLDEYGGVSGVVSVEDIMEEIVGEIQDEYDEENHEDRIQLRRPNGLEVDARVHIDELNERFGLGIPETEDYDTVGGFVTAHFARVPETGEEAQIGNLLVRILQSDARRVRRVLLETVERAESSG